MAARALPQIAGVDGCKAGWIAVTFQLDAFGRAEVKVFNTFANLVGWLQPDAIIAVDMPIGLPERAIKGGRAPDWAAKEFLGPRKGTVFLVPSRRAVYAREAVDTYKQGYTRVCAVARKTSDPPRAPSIQAYSIFPRIQLIDQMLRQDEALRRRVFEVHPEVSFTVMNGDKPIPEPKKVKGRVHDPGMRCRKELLERKGFALGFLEAKPPRGAALDDFYDACASAWSGARISRQEERIFPPEPGIDAKGLQVAIRA
jgi:predicted RNase H-like nuclease